MTCNFLLAIKTQNFMESKKHIQDDENNDGIDRAGFLKCMAWAGTGVLWMMSGGVMKSFGMSQIIDRSTGGLKKGLIIPKSDFNFVQISDSHIGFNKAANTDVVGTLQAAIAKINAMPVRPSFVLHTGDLTQLAQPDEFDTLQQALTGIKTEKIFYVPGEHDVTDNGKLYMERYGKGSQGDGWYSFDSHGVHFIALVNVLTQGDGSFGVLGPGSTCMAGERCKGAFRQYSNSCVCACSVMGCLSSMGLGNKRQRTSSFLSQTFWIGVCSEWPYSSNDTKSRG